MSKIATTLNEEIVRLSRKEIRRQVAPIKPGKSSPTLALTEWVRTGSIRYREDILEGIEHAPGSIASLYRGENLGKRIIRITSENP